MDGSTLHIDLLSGYETSYRLGRSFRREVVRYIERCHLEDGGYFFARVLPSGGLDTYFAVKSLSTLGVKPNRPEAIASFFLNNIAKGALGGITGIFLAVEVLNELGRMTDELRNYAQPRIMALQNKAGGFGAYEDINVEVPSELWNTYRAVKVLKIIGAEFDREKVNRFIFSFLRPDGGYGARGYSTLASTFYATEIHKLLGVEAAKLSATRDYLRRREENEQAQFIEDLYWLVLSLANLGEKTNVPDRVTRFVMMCQRSGGGFSRAMIMGIPTLEYTFYAVSILHETGAL
jgi:hypothetical protein